MMNKKTQNLPPLYSTPTYAEKITGKFDMKEPPTKKQMKRFYIMFFIGLFVLGCQSFTAHACESIKTIEMGDGAGSDWTCGNCGRSNKQWELSCSGCGEWQ